MGGKIYKFGFLLFFRMLLFCFVFFYVRCLFLVKVLVTDPLEEKGVEVLRKAGFDVVVKTEWSPENLLSLVSDVEGLLVRSRTKVTSEVIDAASQLRVIGRAGVGVDNIDVGYAREKGVEVVTAGDAPADSVAELTFGLLISVARSLSEADSTMKEGKWEKKRFMGGQFAGRVLGVVGVGNIGRRVARIAHALGMRILAYDVVVYEDLKEMYGVEYVSLEELLKEADFVTIHVPLLPQTRNMISKKEIGLMKKEAIIVNTARGGILDEEAVYEALVEGSLRGAGFDVYSEEPPKSEVLRKLISLPNVVCTPHIASQTNEAQEAVAVKTAQSVVKILKG